MYLKLKFNLKNTFVNKRQVLAFIIGDGIEVLVSREE